MEILCFHQEENLKKNSDSRNSDIQFTFDVTPPKLSFGESALRLEICAPKNLEILLFTHDKKSGNLKIHFRDLLLRFFSEENLTKYGRTCFQLGTKPKIWRCILFL